MAVTSLGKAYVPREQGSSSHLLEIKNALLVHVRVSNLKTSRAETFVVPFKVLNRKPATGDNVLF